MRYLLALIGPEGGWEDMTPEAIQAELSRWEEFGRQLVEAGAFVAGEGLQESRTATTVHVGSDGGRTVTDGPFAETKEQLGGFYLIECADLDQALAWARRVPLRAGAVEVRPIMDYSRWGYRAPGEDGGAS